MAEVNQRDRTIRVKLVYYGPALGGKTTNLRVLHARAMETRRGDLISINSLQDRTILFDLLPLSTIGPRGYNLRLQVLAVPGQAMYAATRRAVLKGADGVVFVANSATDRWQENLACYAEMKRHLVEHNIDPSEVPLVLQYNKRDLPAVTDVSVMDMGLKTRPERAVLAVASRGEGVIDTFEAILARTLRDLSRKFRTIAVDDTRAPERLAGDAVTGLFGRLAPSDGEEAAEEVAIIERFGEPVEFERDGRSVASDSAVTAVTIRVPVGEPGDGAPGASRAPGAMAEAYAEACTELATTLAEVKEARDAAQRRLEDLHRVASILGDADGTDAATTVRRMLGCLGEAAGAARASFGFLGPDGFERVIGLPAADDPLLTRCSAARRYVRALADASGPRLHDTAGDLELFSLLGSGEPRFGAVASLPVRTSSRAIGIAILYFLEDEPLPAAATLEHLGLLASTFAAPLALAARVEAAQRPEPGRRGEPALRVVAKAR